MLYQQGKKYKRPTKYIKGRGQIIVGRLVMENHIGRKLKSNEVVHHINENPFDNRIENLLLTDRAEHKKIHLEIGEKTRLKKIYKFDSENLKILYMRYRSALPISKKMKCHVITIERELRKIFNCKSLRQYKEVLK